MQHDLTIGVEFGANTINIDGRNVKLQIWDTAGQENYKSITRTYYRSAIGAMLVYDVSKKDSFAHLQNWVDEMKSNGNQFLQVILVGNKCDKSSMREVTAEEGQAFAQEN